jgi:hypothetical protein
MDTVPLSTGLELNGAEVRRASHQQRAYKGKNVVVDRDHGSFLPARHDALQPGFRPERFPQNDSLPCVA